MSKTMKVAAFTGVNEIKLQETKIPKPKGNEILVKVKACALCTWEQRVYNGAKKVKFPFIGGHEVAGEIAELGEDIDKSIWKKGDKVVVGLMTSCGECYYCKIGKHDSCENLNHSKHMKGLPYKGMGGLSEYLLALPYNVFKFKNITDEEATIVEPLSCVIHSVEMANLKLGQNVLVIGCGIMGLLHVILASKKGATVIACDINQDRLNRAKQFGARYTINSTRKDLSMSVKTLTEGRGCDVVFNTTPISNLVNKSFENVGKMGKIVLYSSFYPDRPVEISPDWIHKNSIQIIGTANSNSNDFIKATKMLSNSTIDVKSLISEVYNFCDIENAFESAIKGDKFRVVVKI